MCRVRKQRKRTAKNPGNIWLQKVEFTKARHSKGKNIEKEVRELTMTGYVIAF